VTIYEDFLETTKVAQLERKFFAFEEQACGEQLVEELCYKPDGRWFGSP
jgi:hypothetical protein